MKETAGVKARRLAKKDLEMLWNVAKTRGNKMKREPLFMLSDDGDGLVMTAYEHGSGDTLASCKVDKRLCARWVEKLIQPLVHQSKGYWVGQHGYHP